MQMIISIFFLFILLSCSLTQKKENAFTQIESMGADTYNIQATLIPFSFQTCFLILLKVKSDEKYASFNEWTGKVILKNTEYPLLWTEEALKTPPQKKTASTYFGKTNHYMNQGIACVNMGLALEDEITLKLSPSFIQWPFDETLKLSWDFKSLTKKTPPKIKEKYRGW